MANEEEVKPIVEETPATTEETPKEVPQEDPEIVAKEERKANLDRALAEAQEELRRVREEKRKEKLAPVAAEEIPQIDDTDPSAKAWTRRINDSTAPIASSLDRAKDEVRSFALRRFLSDKPELAKSPEKIKELMSVYDRIKVATETTQEGVLIDLGKAYGATHYDELQNAARDRRLQDAKEDMLFSDAGISRGSSSEAAPAPTKRTYTAEERKIIEQWEASGAPKL